MNGSAIPGSLIAILDGNETVNHIHVHVYSTLLNVIVMFTGLDSFLPSLLPLCACYTHVCIHMYVCAHTSEYHSCKSW